MQQHLLIAALLSAFAGVASAQSQVTLFGTFDLNVRYAKADGQSRRLSENPSGLNSGQFGIRGQEDLGGGLGAGFILLSENNADTGMAGDAVRGKFWNRQSVLRLFGSWGEIRLGRDYTPSFHNVSFFDAFGTLGLGNANNVRQMYGGTRIDNSIAYILPPGTLGGFYGEVRVAAGENGATFDRPGRYVGGRLGYRAGPLDVSGAVGQQRFAVPFSIVTPPVAAGADLIQANAGDTQKTYNIGASYDFGAVKLTGYIDRETLRDIRENMFSVGAIVPFGVSEVHVSFDRSKLTNAGVATAVEQMAIRYVYNLSKRTALYSAASRIDNKNATRITVPGAAGPTTIGGKSQGIEFGIRHFF